MWPPTLAPSTDTAARQRLAITIGAGGSRAALAVDITSTGLLAIGGLVAMTLLSTAVLVHVATRRAS